MGISRRKKFLKRRGRRRETEEEKKEEPLGIKEKKTEEEETISAVKTHFLLLCGILRGSSRIHISWTNLDMHIEDKGSQVAEICARLYLCSGTRDDPVLIILSPANKIIKASSDSILCVF